MELQLDTVLSSDQLPSLPQVAVHIVQLVQQPEPDFSELVSTIKTDPAIAAKILKTVNSALFGLRERVSSIEAAVPNLGTNLVRTLVLSFALARHRCPSDHLTDSYQCVWRGSLTQAVVAETLALLTGSNDAEVFFIAGLLQDIGVLAMLRTYPTEYVNSVLRAAPSASRYEAELRQLGFSHVDIGVELCRRWNLEDELIQAISLHHEPPDTTNQADSPELVLALMAAAQCAEYLEGIRAETAPDQERFPAILADHYGLVGAAASEFLREIELRVGEVAAMFSVDIGTIPPVDEILARAKVLLEELAIQGQLEAVAARREADQARRKLKQAKDKSKKLEHSADRDPLTGTYNRHFMATTLDQELTRAHERGFHLGVLFLDVDDFKGLNDTHGHAVGDRALVTVAQILHRSMRAQDLVIRYGGDEFLVVVIDRRLTRGKLRKMAERICRKISRARLAGGKPIPLSSSVGAVYYSPNADAVFDPQRLIRQADRAMYDAKQRGGNQVQLFIARHKDSGSLPLVDAS